MSRDESDQEFLATLQRLQPATVLELCSAQGVTATAVRQKLLRFQSEGFVQREVSRQHRGRPRHEYRLTSEGVRELGDDYAVMASLLWREVMKIQPVDVRNQVLVGLKTSMVKRFSGLVDQATLASKMQHLTKVMSSQGFDLEVGERSQKSGVMLPILREHNCPYHELALEDASICELEQAVYAELLGTKVELSACQLDGHRCCEFMVGEAESLTGV